jgi:FtsP/CotA-like multicopper oxidase with cupredoxin domain
MRVLSRTRSGSSFACQLPSRFDLVRFAGAAVAAIATAIPLLLAVGCASSGGPPAAPAAPSPPTARAEAALSGVPLLPGEQPHANPSELADGESYRLIAGLANVRIGDKNYCLRTYNGQLPGPTMIVPEATTNPPARQLRVDLVNAFGRACPGRAAAGAPDDKCACQGADCYDFNATNLHTHGLHVRPDVSPVAPYLSDHVLMELSYDRVSTHHGGAAIPAGACGPVAGAFRCGYLFAVDEGSRYVPGPAPKQHEPGTFWYHAHLHGATAIQVANGMAGALIIRGPVDRIIPEIAQALEQVMVLQQIPLEVAREVSPDHRCDPTNPGDYSINAFGSTVSAKRTLVNGRRVPVIGMQPGEVQRWRLIHAGITEELKLALEGPVKEGECRKGRPPSGRLPLHEIAADGITMTHVRSQEMVRMDPGYRSDVMVQLPRDTAARSEYCLIDQAGVSLQDETQTEPRELVAVLRAFGPPKPMSLPTDAQLAAVAKPPLDCNAAPGPVRKTVFFQRESGGKACPTLNINCKNFPDVEFDLELGATETWQLSSETGRHPYHIHVNPFTVCEEAGVRLDKPYWRDTLLLDPGPSYEIRSRYLGFTGAFVLHCHRLDHEDRGMMGLVTIR